VRRRVVRAALAALVLATAGAAQAGENDVAVLSLDIMGLPRGSTPGFEGSLEVGLQNRGWRITRSEEESKRLLEGAVGVVRGCRIGPCLQAVGRVLEVSHVVEGTVIARGAQFDVMLTLLDTQTGNAVGQAVRTCPVCTLDEALVLVSAAAEDIVTASSVIQPAARARIWIPAPLRESGSWRRSAGIAGLLLGVAAIGVGLALDEADQTSRGVAALWAGGGVAFLGGALLMGSDDPGPRGSLRRGHFVSVMGIQMGFKW